MSERRINLKEIFENNYDYETMSDRPVMSKEIFIDVCKEFGKKLLELAAENAKICTDTMCSPYCEDWVKYVDKQSILDTIKQVE